MLYIFKSTYKIEYANRIREMLALPIGSEYKIRSYKNKYIMPEILNAISRNSNAFQGEHGIIFAVGMDYDKNQLKNIYPIRECEILEIRPEGGYCSISVHLGKYFGEYDLQKIKEEILNEFGISLNNFPLNGYWVLPGSGELSVRTAESSEETDVAWTSLVNKIGSMNINKKNDVPKMNSRIFYRIKGIFDEKGSSTQFDEKNRIKLRSKKIYELQFSFRDPKNDGEPLLEVKGQFSSAYFRSIGSNKFEVRSPEGTDSIKFECKDVSEREIKDEITIEDNSEDLKREIGIPVVIEIQKKKYIWALMFLLLFVAGLTGKSYFENPSMGLEKIFVGAIFSAVSWISVFFLGKMKT